MGAASYDAWAAFGNFMSNAMMRRAEAKDEDERYAIRAELQEKALEQREIAREERAAKRRENTTADRRVFQGDASDGPPELLVEETNEVGNPLRTVPASQREKREFADRSMSNAALTEAERRKQRIADEDRMLDRADKNKRTSIAERNAAASELRASRYGIKEDKTEKPLSRNEALKALSSFRYRSEEGESARAVAKRDGLRDEDYDDLVRIAGSGKSKEPGAFERGAKAIGSGLSSLAERFAPKESTGRSVMAERKSGEKKPKEESPYPEGTKLRGKDGKIYVIRNGEPVLEGG